MNKRPNAASSSDFLAEGQQVFRSHPHVAMTSINKSCRDSWVGCICKGEKLNLEEWSHPYHCHPIPSMSGIFTCLHLVDFYGVHVGKYTSPMAIGYAMWNIHLISGYFLWQIGTTCRWIPASSFFRQVCVKLPLPKDQRCLKFDTELPVQMY